jgi:hypothetical protein
VTTAQAVVATTPVDRTGDRRGSWLPTWSMMTTRLLELRKRRGVMITIGAVLVGIPSVFLAIRLLMHAVDPKAYGPAGGSSIYTGLVAGVMYVFGFIVAALLGCTAGSSDLSDGMFRHLVVTGRSRLALYLARIPAGLAIIVSAVAIGFAIVCVVCCLAAPTTIAYNGANVPKGLSLSGFESWAGAHPDTVYCDFNFGPGVVAPNLTCPGGYNVGGPPGTTAPTLTPVQLRAGAIQIAAHFQNYQGYSALFIAPPISLMVGSGLWLELEAIIGFIVGLGLSSLLGQRTVAVILLIVLEIVLTPIMSRVRIPYLINAQRAVVGIATAHLKPNGLPRVFGTGGGRDYLLPEATDWAIVVIIAWLVVWTAFGAWRMMTRDA